MGFITGVLVVLALGPFVWKAFFPQVHSIPKSAFLILLGIGGIAGVVVEQWFKKNLPKK